MTVPSENRPTTRAAAARLAGVSAPTIAGWITKGWLPAAPPWTATALAEAKARASNSGPPFTAEHGSVSRYRASCRCEPCQQAHVDDTTSRRHLERSHRYRLEVLEAIAADLSRGQPYAAAVRAHGLTMQGLSIWLYQHPEDRKVIDDGLMAGRDAGLLHGTPSAWRSGCRCPDCREYHQETRGPRPSRSRPRICVHCISTRGS